MTARPDTELRDAPAQPQAPDIALVLAGIGAVLAGFAPVPGVVAPHTAPAFTSWPLLFTLAAAPPVLAALLRSRPRMAAAVLLGPAVLAPGRAVADLQLFFNPVRAARPELLVPDSVTALHASTGLWLLLAGHLATAVAGVLASRQRPTDSATAAFAEDAPVSHRPRMLALVLCASGVAALGILMAPFASDDPFLLPHAALDSPGWVLTGTVLVAVAGPVVGGYVVATGDAAFARGGLLGLAVALGAVVVPPLVAAAVTEDLHFGWGAVVGLIAAVLVGLLAIPAGRPPTGSGTQEPRLPALARMLTAAGTLAVASGVVAVLVPLTRRLDLLEGVRDPSAYPARMLLPAGAVLILLGIGLVVPRTAGAVRPVLSAAWAVVPLAGVGVLDAVFSATQAAGMSGLEVLRPTVGLGTWLTGAAVLLAVLAAIAAALGGAVERDDVDLTEVAVHRAAAGPALLAVPLAIAAFAFPVLTAADYTPPGLLGEFRMASWGLVLGMLTVAVAAALAPRCRPGRAAGLLCGAALVVVQRVLEFPLTAGRFEEVAVGAGLWAALACLAALLAALATTLTAAGRAPATA